VAAADFRIHLVDLAGESIRRKPFRHRVGIKECAVDGLRCGAEHAVKANCVGCHDCLCCRSALIAMQWEIESAAHGVPSIGANWNMKSKSLESSRIKIMSMSMSMRFGECCISRLAKCNGLDKS
jgi:hypothetical protein